MTSGINNPEGKFKYLRWGDNMSHSISSWREENMQVCIHPKAAPENEIEPWLETQIVLELVLQETQVLHVGLPSWVLETLQPWAMTTLFFCPICPSLISLINLTLFPLVSRLRCGHSGWVWHVHSPAWAAIVPWSPPAGIIPPRHIRRHHFHQRGELWGRCRDTRECGL